jgi:hypothetical protein
VHIFVAFPSGCCNVLTANHDSNFPYTFFFCLKERRLHWVLAVMLFFTGTLLRLSGLFAGLASCSRQWAVSGEAAKGITPFSFSVSHSIPTYAIVLMSMGM